MNQTHSICEYCSTGFSCARLATALRLLEADAALPKDEGRKRRLIAIKTKLIDFGWSYPGGGHHCMLVGHPEQVQALTDELIDLLDARKHPTTKHLEDEPRLLDEEMTRD